DDVDEVEDDAPLAAHDEVEIAQADVEVDHHRLLAAHREPGAQGGRGSGLADPALARGDDDHMSQRTLLISMHRCPMRASTEIGLRPCRMEADPLTALRIYPPDYGQPLVLQHDLRLPAVVLLADLVADEIAAGDADELGLEALDEDARRVVAGG